jgi:hypothetical protein
MMAKLPHNTERDHRHQHGCPARGLQQMGGSR